MQVIPARKAVTSEAVRTLTGRPPSPAAASARISSVRA
jgi:hypothetical protein